MYPFKASQGIQPLISNCSIYLTPVCCFGNLPCHTGAKKVHIKIAKKSLDNLPHHEYLALPFISVHYYLPKVKKSKILLSQHPQGA